MLRVYHHHSPAVSVIMATYNRAAYLHRSITSFQKQSVTDAELIIVDDGSEDDTFQVVNSFIKTDKRIRYLRHSNRKLSLSRNAGISAAAGRYIAFLDSDDEYLPDYLETRVYYLESNPDKDLVQGAVHVIGHPFVRDKNDPAQEIHLSACSVGATFFGRKGVFEQLGGFNEDITYSEDSEFWERARQHFRTGHLSHTGYIYYRDTPGSICNTVL